MVVAREGKAGRRTRKPDPDAEARKAHYLQSKQTAKDIKSGTTVKAIGSTGTASNKTLTTGTKTTQSQHQGLVKPGVSGKSTPKPGKSPATSGKSTPRFSKSPSVSGKSTPKSIKSPSVSGTTTPKARSSTPVNDPKNKPKPDSKPKNKAVNEKLENASNTKPKPKIDKKLLQKKQTLSLN